MSNQQRVDSEFLWKNARQLPVGETMKIGVPYIFSESARRGLRTVSILGVDGKMAFYTVQRVPDSFLDECKRSRELWSGMSSVRRNAFGMMPNIEIPDALAQTLYSKEGDGGKQLDPLDPEREKRLKKFSNDGDYAKLRLSEGRV